MHDQITKPRNQLWDLTGYGYDKDDNEIEVPILVEYESEWQGAEKDVGVSAGHIIHIYGATVEETGEPYDYQSEEEEYWSEIIARNL